MQTKLESQQSKVTRVKTEICVWIFYGIISTPISKQLHVSIYMTNQPDKSTDACSSMKLSW